MTNAERYLLDAELKKLLDDAYEKRNAADREKQNDSLSAAARRQAVEEWTYQSGRISAFQRAMSIVVQAAS